MKLFWKQFISTVCIVALIFTVFGAILLHTSFQMALDREKERGKEDTKMFQYAMLTSIQGLPEHYEAKDTAIKKIAESIEKSLNDGRNEIRIYNQEKEIVYQNSEFESSLIKSLQDVNQAVYRISRQGNAYYLESVCSIKQEDEIYYIERSRDISYVYTEREHLYARYRVLLISCLILAAILSLILSMRFTRPIIRLSKATQSFAKGEYRSRVKISGNDEITSLMQDFNGMAGELELSIIELKDNVRKQEEFTGAFSHELKTPLTSIIGYAEMLRSMDMSKEDTALSANYIYEQGKRLERLSFKMMELVGMDKHAVEISWIPTKRLEEKISNVVKESLKQKELKLITEVEEGSIYGEVDLLISLFANLIDNARKASERGQTIWLLGSAKENGYEFTVKDEGKGIPAEEIHKIKEAFYMVDKSRARKEGGAGIGMALCEKIIKFHGAKSNIESKVDEGTKITISFEQEVG